MGCTVSCCSCIMRLCSFLRPVTVELVAFLFFQFRVWEPLVLSEPEFLAASLRISCQFIVDMGGVVSDSPFFIASANL